MGLVAPRHVGSSRTRARTRVPCIGRRILNHCATREVPVPDFFSSTFCLWDSPILHMPLAFLRIAFSRYKLIHIRAKKVPGNYRKAKRRYKCLQRFHHPGRTTVNILVIFSSILTLHINFYTTASRRYHPIVLKIFSMKLPSSMDMLQWFV